MTDSRPVLTLAHSPDPDDAFMWWPITGKVRPDGAQVSGPVLDTGRFRFQAVPADIEVLNKKAAAEADLDITALSFRAWAAVREKYIITRTGSSFGEGYGPKVVCPQGSKAVHCENCLRNNDVRIAVPGRRTTAFLVLGMMLGKEHVAEGSGGGGGMGKIVEMPFDQVIGAVVRGQVDAGLVIHEGQVLYEAAGLRLVVDLGEWWKKKTGLPVPLGCNAVRRDLDARFGKGSLAEVSATLRRSVDYALAHRAESLEYTMPFALANAIKADSRQGLLQSSSSPQRGARLLPGVALHPWSEPTNPPPSSSSPRPRGASDPATLDQIDRYVTMYVNRWTVDIGEEGIAAVNRLFEEGNKAGLCEAIAAEVV